MNDTRIALGAQCTWWDSIDKAAKLSNGLPCCPFCSRVLFEYPNEAAWWKDVKNYSEKEDDPDYPDFVEWLRGRDCITDWKKAREIFNIFPKCTCGHTRGNHELQQDDNWHCISCNCMSFLEAFNE